MYTYKKEFDPGRLTKGLPSSALFWIEYHGHAVINRCYERIRIGSDNAAALNDFAFVASSACGNLDISHTPSPRTQRDVIGTVYLS